MVDFIKGKSNTSKVRVWAKEQRETKVNKRPIEYLSDSLIYGLSTFCDPTAPTRKENPISEISKKARNQYSGDTCLFEVGCYLYFRLDFWHYKTNIQKGNLTILEFCIKQFLKVFEKAMQVSNINDIYDNRINLYAKIIKESENVLEERHHYLTQLLIRTKNNSLPVIYDFTDFPLIIIDAVELTFLDIAIKAFELGMIPACIETMQKFYDIIDTSN